MESAIILGFLACFFVFLDNCTGASLVSRPIVVGTVTGFFMGDLQTGIILGATLELIFIGGISVGAALPPEMISGTILATAFAISSGQGMEAALTLGLPIATLALIFKNLSYVLIFPIYTRLSDKAAEKGDSKKICFYHMTAGFVTWAIPLGILVGLTFYFGNTVVEKVLLAIPTFVKDGLAIATGILPALGFAVLARMILNKKVAVFFLLGFVLSAYLKLPILAIALIAFVMAYIILTNQNNTVSEASSEEDDF